MSLLEDLQTVIDPLGVPIETGVFSGTAPDRYIVVTPLTDSFDLHSDDTPGMDVQEVRLSLFCKGSYTRLKNALVKALLAHELTITDRRYVGYETDTGYHHYTVDVANYYEMEE